MTTLNTAFKAGRRADSRDFSLARFKGAAVEPSRAIGLRADHPAVVEGRTLFPSTVKPALDAPALLVSGRNNAKLGADVRKGAWRGRPIYQLTLEERATCPRSCAVWADCYGNAMHLARRHDHRSPDFLALLEAELRLLGRLHRRTGYVVRLHTLGDFFSADYVAFWARMLDALPGLFVFGYTAFDPASAHAGEAEIGAAVAALAEQRFDRFAVRLSLPRHRIESVSGARASVVVRSAQEAEALGAVVCPAQTGASAACATCGLCWAAAYRHRPIAFLRHGMKVKTAAGREPPPTQLRAQRRSRAPVGPKAGARTLKITPPSVISGGRDAMKQSRDADLEARRRAIAHAGSIPADPKELARLIAEAEAAGRVQRLSLGYAAGLEKSGVCAVGVREYSQKLFVRT